MNWDDPAARYALIETVGPDRYNEMLLAHNKASTIDTVNGYAIRPTSTRFGLLYMIAGADVAFSTLDAARQRAMELPYNG